MLSVRPMGALTMPVRHLRLALQGAEGALDVVRPIVADLTVGGHLDLPGADVSVSAGRPGAVTLPQTLDAAIDAGFTTRFPVGLTR